MFISEQIKISSSVVNIGKIIIMTRTRNVNKHGDRNPKSGRRDDSKKCRASLVVNLGNSCRTMIHNIPIRFARSNVTTSKLPQRMTGNG